MVSCNRHGWTDSRSCNLQYNYLVADLDTFCVALGQSRFRRTPNEGLTPADLKIQGSWCKLTRFLRGQPSPTPDLRTPKDLEELLSRGPIEIEPIPGAGALHVHTMTGKVVLSMQKSE
ncbi:unnamed protein product, partial [Polarella glacialis]